MTAEENRAKRAAYAREWRKRNPDKMRAQSLARKNDPERKEADRARYRAKTKEYKDERAAKAKKEYWSDPAIRERRKAAARRWCVKNPEAVRARSAMQRAGKFGKEYEREKYAKNPFPKRAAAARWYLNNKDTAKATALRYRAGKHSAPGRVVKGDVERITSILGRACLRCGRTDRIQWDHVIPLSVGGSSNPTNIQPLCCSCNPSKGNRSRADYRTKKQVKEILKAFQLNLITDGAIQCHSA